ncbi:MAG: hypothetical protein KatS3mg102_0818 [Planctomycetota bacterium]|nr:MAG: hypothetical protein KatS3mg102_0818 [Planctomycetota bacterium]
MSGAPVLTAEQQQALRIDTSVAVTAGAGTGKTATLVARYLAHLEGDAARGVPPLAPHRILAITFTEKAATEMRERVLAELARRGAPPELRQQVLQAPISTIHAWCGQLLREHAIEAEIDPGYQVLDEPRAQLLFAEVLEELLDACAGGWAPVRPLLAAGWTRARLRLALQALARQRERAARWAQHLLTSDDAALLAHWRRGEPEPLEERLRSALALADRLAESLARAPAGDKLRAVLQSALELAGECRQRLQAGDPHALRVWLRAALLQSGLVGSDGSPRSFGRLGQRARWQDGEALEQARQALAEFAAALPRQLHQMVADLDAAAIPALRALAELWLELLKRYQHRKRVQAAVDFDDLIERAASLLGDPSRQAVRARLQARYRAVLVDEFQDVDERQLRLIEALCCDASGRVAPGRLFIVGDDKQSIYRFRGADVSVFRRLRARIAQARQPCPDPERPPATVSLRDNWRTLQAPLAFANAVFDRLFRAPEGAPGEPFGAEPGALRGRRTAAPGSVRLLLHLLEAGEETAEAGTAAERSEGESEPDGDEPGAFTSSALEEARLVARLLRRLLGEDGGPPLQLGERLAGGGERLRPLRAADVALLLRSRTHLKLYEDALRRHGIPFVVHGGMGLFDAPEVVDVLNLLRFLADEGDDLALAGLLRSPLALLSDEALYAVARLRAEPAPATLWQRLRAAAGNPAPELLLAQSERQAVGRAAHTLAGLAALAWRVPAAELVRRALEASGAWAAYAVGPRGPQALANLERLLDVVRELQARTSRGLGELAALLVEMAEVAGNEGEAAVCAEATGVQIMTVHAAKGLEFPLVVVPECGTVPPPERDPVVLEERGLHGEDGLPLYDVGIKVADPQAGYRDGSPGLREQLRERSRRKQQAEHLRLLYVAITRARDHLVLSGSCRRGAAGLEPRRGSWLAMLCQALGLEQAPLAGRRLVLPTPAEAPPDGAPRAVEVQVLTGQDLAEPPAQPVAQRDSEQPYQGEPEPEPLLAALGGAAGHQGATAATGSLPADGPPLDLEAVVRPCQRPLAPARAMLSPSRWKLFASCPRRYYYRVVLGLPEELGGRPVAPEGEDLEPPAAPHPALAALGRQRPLVRGSAVHRLLELGLPPTAAERERAVQAVLQGMGVEGDAELGAEVLLAAERAAASLERTGLAGEIARARCVYREHPFVLRLHGGVIEGTIDLLLEDERGWTVVDYKTDELQADQVEAAVRERGYDAQIGLYALAAATLCGLGPDRPEGPEPRVRATLLFTQPGVRLDRAYGQAELAAIASRAARDLEDIAAGRFPRGSSAPCEQCGFARPPARGAPPLCDVALAGQPGAIRS